MAMRDRAQLLVRKSTHELARRLARRLDLPIHVVVREALLLLDQQVRVGQETVVRGNGRGK